MSGFDIFFSILLIVLGVFGGFTSIVRKSRRGQSKFVAFVVSVLFLLGGIVCLIFGLPAAEFFMD